VLCAVLHLLLRQRCVGFRRGLVALGLVALGLALSTPIPPPADPTPTVTSAYTIASASTQPPISAFAFARARARARASVSKSVCASTGAVWATRADKGCPPLGSSAVLSISVCVCVCACATENCVGIRGVAEAPARACESGVCGVV